MGRQKASVRIFFLIGLFLSISSSLISQYNLFSQAHGSITIRNNGIVTFEPLNVTIDYGLPMLTNNLSLGVQIVHEVDTLISSSLLQQKLSLCHFKLIRVFVTESLKPCVHWDEANDEGIYDWDYFDSVISLIYHMGAEPMLVLDRAPDGIYVDPDIRLPDSESFAQYAEDLTQHAKDKGWNIKYWEIWNEPQHSVIIKWGDEDEVSRFVNFFNIVAERIHEILPDALCGTDSSNVNPIFDYFSQYAYGVGFLSFHKYDADGTWLSNPEGYLSDKEVIEKAAQGRSYSYEYTFEEMRDIWKIMRGEELPIICSETNLNSQWRNGTDPRIQQPIGAVWYAEELRSFITGGVEYSVYYHFASDDSPNWETTKQTEGAGFGMVNDTLPHVEWYPYLVNYLIGSNLCTGDAIVYSSSTNQTMLSTVAWKTAEQSKLLLICKVDSLVRVVVKFIGLSINPEAQVNIMRIDSNEIGLQIETVPYEANLNFSMNGYSVLLLTI